MEREEMVKTLKSRMYSRLGELNWGVNCSSLQDALCFPEDWLFGNFSRREKRQAISLLAENSFICNLAFKARLRVCVWRMPLNPGEDWKEIRDCYESSYLLEQRRAEEEAECKLLNFLNANAKSVCIETKNTLFRAALLKKIEEYNRANTRKFFGITKNLLQVQSAAAGNYTYIAKEGAAPQIHMYLESRDRCYWGTLQMMALHLVNGVETCRYFNKTNKIRYAVPTEYINGIKTMLMPFGIIIDKFPRYPEWEYAQFGINAKSTMYTTVYITLHNLKYDYEERFSQNLNMALQKLCSTAKF